VDKASQAPLKFVTVTLLRSDSSMVGGAVTDSLGQYKVKGIAAGSYIVKYSYVGFAPTKRHVTVKGSQTACRER